MTSTELFQHSGAETAPQTISSLSVLQLLVCVQGVYTKAGDEPGCDLSPLGWGRDDEPPCFWHTMSPAFYCLCGGVAEQLCIKCLWM